MVIIYCLILVLHFTVEKKIMRLLFSVNVQVLEKKNKELKQSEEKLKAVNSELCTKMREMIHELDQEKQEAAQR